MIYGFDEFELDAESLELRRDGKLVKADALVVRLLVALVRNPDRLLTKDELIDQVWQGRAVADNVITVSMARLRKTLGQGRSDRELVATVYGRGYRFVREVSARAPVARTVPAPQDLGTGGPPFVGRERVLGRLRQALNEAVAGRGRVCALLGEPGIGKTRVVEALEREISGSVRVAWGYCRETGDAPPLWPWLRLLREVTAGAWTPDLEQRGEARHDAFEAMLRTLAQAAESTPRVLVLDDLHAADAASIELLSLLLDQIAHMRILVIATLRHARGSRAPRPDTHLPQVLGHRNCERIALDRLSLEDVHEYVAAMIDDRDGNLAKAVFAKSEGNPFFMTELSRHLRDAEHPDPSALSLPDTALELIRQGVGKLGAETRELLSAAAVIGRSFELPLLAAITEREPAALMPSLDEALAEEVLVVAPDSMTAFAFGHELLRAVLYDALPPREQRRWHLRIAQAMEQRTAAGDATPPSEIAFHFHAALPESDLRKTVEYCGRAAAAAGAVFANSDVVRYARHALEALDLMDNPSVRLRAGLLYMTALYQRGHAVEFPRAIREVMRLAEEHGDGQGLVRAACMLNPHPGFKPVPGCSAALIRALDLLSPDDAGTRAVALAALACAAPQCYSAERVSELLDEALLLAHKAGGRTTLRVTLEAKLYFESGPGHAKESAEIVAELERLWRERPSRMPVLPAELALHHAIGALQQGDAAAMTKALDTAAARCRELRHGELLWHTERFRALHRVNSGAWSDGIAELEALHRRAEQRPMIGTEPFCAFDRVVVFGELVGVTALDDAMRNALELDASDPPSIWALKVRALSAAGLEGEARAALRAVAPAELARLPRDRDHLGTLGHLARAALQPGALDYAETVHALLAPHSQSFAGHVSFLCEGSVPQLLGALSHALGRRSAALAELEAGAQMNESAGFAPRAAEARLQWARCLLDRGTADERRRGLDLAREAQARAERLGMQRLARDAAAVAAG
ncbi:MAG: AAA family ATPase [Polyangiales bacterium]